MSKDGPFIVSACLAGVNCRMEGGNKLVPEIKRLVDEGKSIPVCPEELGGLPTPRDPSEQRNGRVFSKSGKDVTAEFIRGAEESLRIGREHGCTCAILKAKSPSCGVGLIHNGRFDGGLMEGNGVFTQMLLDAGIPVMMEQEFLAAILSITEL